MKEYIKNPDGTLTQKETFTKEIVGINPDAKAADIAAEIAKHQAAIAELEAEKFLIANTRKI